MALEDVEFRLGAVDTVLVTEATAPAVLVLRAVDTVALEFETFQGV